MITAECVKERCVLWSGKCSEIKKNQEKLLSQKHQPIPEWVCQWPYPGANVDEEDEYAIRNSRYKKD